MARKSLSSQVIAELDRCRGLLKPVQEISDPMTGHMIGQALDSLHRIETMCLSASQQAVNAALSDTPLAVAFTGDALSQAQAKKRTTAHRAPRKPKEA